MSDVRVVAYAATSKGLVREANEDSHLVGGAVFAVADGMGGHAAGEVASATALQPLSSLDGRVFSDDGAATEALAAALEVANAEVFDRAAADPELRGMGTTLTAALIRDGRLHLAHVGDSRAYLLRDGELLPLTTDHTLVQQLIEEGRLSPGQAAAHPHRNVITRAIGVDASVQIDVLEPPMDLHPGDQVLLCSDGLTGVVDDADIAALLNSEEDGQRATQRLVDAANAGGGPDNTTVVLLRVTGERPVDPAPLRSPLPATDDDATAELDPPVEHDEDAPGFDAQRLRRLAEGGAIDDTPAPLRHSRARRIVSVAIAVLLLLAVVGGGLFLVLSRAYFVGIDDGQVAIFRGIPGSFAGIDLAVLVERTDIAAGDLPERLREPLEEGVTRSSLAEARTYVSDTLRREMAPPQPTPRPTLNPSPTPSPTPRPTPSPTPTSGTGIPQPEPRASS